MGAGPAGLTAAYELLKRDVPVTVVEKDPKQVGGLARTVEYKGYRFDIGGRPFFSQKEQVEEGWTEVIRTDVLTRRRRRSIYYRGRYFPHPIKASHTPSNLA